MGKGFVVGSEKAQSSKGRTRPGSDDGSRSHLSSRRSSDRKSLRSEGLLRNLTQKSREDSRRDSRRGSFMSASVELTVPSALPSSRALARMSRYDGMMGNMIRFDKLGCYGREDEIRLLEDALERVTSSSNNKKRELIIVHGESGSGKTALALTLKRKVVARKNGCFVLGKFNKEDLSAGRPYQAIGEACSLICKFISQSTQKSSKSSRDSGNSVQDGLEHKLSKKSKELKILAQMVPGLAELLMSQEVTSDQGTPTNESSDSNQLGMYLEGSGKSQARFVYAFKSFFRIVNQFIHPLAVVLDDVQWADTASISLIETLLNDEQNPNMFLICLYRSEEMPETHSFARLLRDIKKQAYRPDSSLQISELTTGNLSVSVVSEILVDILNWDNHCEEILTLAELCHKRSLGNPFFLVAYLRRLWDTKLLQYNLSTHRFSWNIDEIMASTMAMSNVVNLMMDEMKMLPLMPHQRRLTIAACFGNSFNSRTISTVLDEIEGDSAVSTTSQGDEDYTELDNRVAFAHGWGFIEQRTKSGIDIEWVWIHDSVREAALSLLDPEELRTLKGRIGKLLLKSLSEAEADASVFVIANLLHEGPLIESSSERIQLAEMNLSAARKAMGVSSLASAGKYARRGIDLLPDDKWESQKLLTLDLWSIAATTEAVVGPFEEVERRLLEVAPRTDIRLEDKIDIYTARINVLAYNETKFDEAIELTLSLLEEFGIKFPKTKAGRVMSTVKQLIRIRRKCKKLTSDDIDKLPNMEMLHVHKLKLFHTLSIFSYVSETYRSLMPLAFFATFDYTFRYGLSEYASVSLASLGAVFSGRMKDYELGANMGYLATHILDEHNYAPMTSHTSYLVSAMLRPWLDPLASCQTEFLRGYEVGLQVGDTEFGCWHAWSTIVAGFQTGRSLIQLEHDCRIYYPQMVEYGMRLAISDLTLYWLFFVQLMGDTRRSNTLGDTDWSTSLEEYVAIRGNVENNIKFASILRTMLCSIFGRHEEGAKLAIERGDGFGKSVMALFPIMVETFHRGVSLYAMAIETEKAKYKRHARKVHATIRKWRKCGNPNVVHYEKFLDAELSTLRGEYHNAESLYQSARLIASRSGHVHDAALAAERCGEMHLRHRQNRKEAANMLTEAIKGYTEWGAHAKVKQLQAKHFDLFP